MARAGKPLGVFARCNLLAEHIVDGVTLLLLRVVLVPTVEWKDLRDARTDPGKGGSGARNEKQDQDLASISTGDPARAEFLFQLQEAASTHTDEKVRQLLSLATALLAASFAAVSAHGFELRWAVAFGMLTAVMFLCFAYFGVRQYESPNPPAVGEGAPEVLWAMEVCRAMSVNEVVHNLRVEMYRAAQRWLFATIVVSVGLAVWFAKPLARGERVVLPGHYLGRALRVAVDSEARLLSGLDSAQTVLIGGITLLPSGDWLGPRLAGRYALQGDSIVLEPSRVALLLARDSGVFVPKGGYRVWADSTQLVLKGPRELLVLSRAP